ncbi:MAG TPA: LuxR C-terminal-related transcriptional regulator, partial [Chitinophagaceae bacterium]|nr:LuxR C-terminal-related transcriptional regulator [Chitinophagaceae bacterium]
VADFTRKSFVFVHKGCHSVLGYPAKYLTEGGIDSLLGNLHPEDFEVVNNEIYKKNFGLLQTLKPEDVYNYVFCHSYRFKNKSGDYTTVLQKLSYLLSPDNKPIGAVGCISDISMCSNGNQMVHLIEHINQNEADKSKEVIYKNYFFHDLENTVISKRETEILKWLSEGLISKEIADKLDISVNTVNNHRKNMLQKTNSKNVAELLLYAVSQHII